MSDYRVKITVSNARIRRAMEAAGYTAVLPMCRANNLNITETFALINMKLSPLNKEGEWRTTALRLADTLNVLPDDLFSERQKTVTVKTNQGYRDVEESELVRIANEQQWNDRLEDMQDNAAIRQIAAEQADVFLNAAMETVLTPQQVAVIKGRFGFDGAPKSLEQVGKDLNISRERVRQIEANALKKMKMPYVQKFLKETM